MELRVQPLTTADITLLVTWEYSGPYAMYNMAAQDLQSAVDFFGDPLNGYFALVDERGDLAGFCNFGADARVHGGDYSDEALDIGMGMRPDLTGKGQGKLYAAAVFEYAGSWYPHPIQRVTIAAFNKRAQNLCRGFGFQETAKFNRPDDGQAFIVMTRDISCKQ